MSHLINSLNGVIYGDYTGTTIGVIKEYTRGSDYGSYYSFESPPHLPSKTNNPLLEFRVTRAIAT